MISPANSAKCSPKLSSEVETVLFRLENSQTKWAMYWFQFWSRVITQLKESIRGLGERITQVLSKGK